MDSFVPTLALDEIQATNGGNPPLVDEEGGGSGSNWYCVVA